MAKAKAKNVVAPVVTDATCNPKQTSITTTTERTSETYMVPPEVAVAVMAGRVEMLAVLRARIEKGETIPKEQIMGLIKLVEDAIKDTERDRNHLSHLLRLVESARMQTKKNADDLASLSRSLVITKEEDKE